MDVLKHRPTRPRASTAMGALSRSQLSLNKIVIRIISTAKYHFRLYSSKGSEFWTICQLATCDDRRPRIDLPPYAIITLIISGMMLDAQDYRENGTRALQKALARFRSGHLKPIKFQNGERIFLRVSSLPVLLIFLFLWVSVSWRHLMAKQERIFELLVRRGLLDLV
ncbi:hypothetical protein TNCV_1500411 [Trichonephila clavipes]|nr:hypothetical protein TNCV_1500411 [Trichonephila clavipes]